MRPNAEVSTLYGGLIIAPIMRRLAYLPVLLLCAGVAFSQDVSLTLFDEIEDAAERRALREVWSAAADPARQQRLAIAFTEQFPASIALKEAYELAARTSVTLGDHERGLDWAQRSLRLLPENPFLLVMTADTAAKLQAIRSCRSARTGRAQISLECGRLLRRSGPPNGRGFAITCARPPTSYSAASPPNVRITPKRADRC